MRVAAVLLVLVSTASSPAWALDVSRLPDGCKAMIEASKADKPQFAQLSATMTKARKGKDQANFCAAAKGTLTLVKGEDEKLDQCLGELSADKTATPDTVGQFTEIKSYYRKIIGAAKDAANDHMHCGLAD